MEQFIKTLEKELNRYFYASEIKEILAYYEEMILERQDQGGSIDRVIASYDIKAIIQQMAPQMILKRDRTVKDMSKSAWLILIILVSTPLLLPVGITYFVLLLVTVILSVTGFVILVSGGISLLALLIDFSVTNIPLANRFMILGIGLIAVGFLGLVGFGFFRGFKWLFVQMIRSISRLIQSYGGKK